MGVRGVVLKLVQGASHLYNFHFCGSQLPVSCKNIKSPPKGSSIKVFGIFKGGRGVSNSDVARYQKVEGEVNQGQNSDMGEGGIKNGQTNSDVFYGRPLTAT